MSVIRITKLLNAEKKTKNYYHYNYSLCVIFSLT